MSIFHSFLRSVLLTSVLSFMVPVLLIAIGLTSCTLVSHIPHLANIGQLGGHQLLQFLAIFGSGDPWEGFLVIGLTCSFVGALFDAYVFYQKMGVWGSNKTSPF